MTISEFCEQRFLRYHAVSPGTRQEYGYVAKNHMVFVLPLQFRGSAA